MVAVRRLLVLVVAASACVVGISRAQSELIPLKVHVLPVLSFAPHHIAQAEGFFEAQGLAVEFIQTDASSILVPTLLSGEIDVLGGSLNAGIINALARGGTARIVADKGSFGSADDCSTAAFLVRPDLLESMDTLDADAARALRYDLPSNPSAFMGYLLDAILTARYGITVNDIDLLEVETPLVGEALTNGSLDVAAAIDPQIVRWTDDESGALWVGANAVFPNFSYAFITFGPNLLEGDADVGTRFMTAYLQGVRQYNEGKTERNLDILAAATELDADVLERACFPQIHVDGAIDIDSVRAYQDWAFERGFIDVILEADQVYDPRFIEAANMALDSE